MNGILALFTQDFKRLLTNALFWIITVTLVLIIIVVNFVLPKDVSNDHLQLVSYHVDVGILSETVRNEAELRRRVSDDGAVGLLGSDVGTITVVHSGLSDKAIHALMQQLYTNAVPTVIEVESLYEDSPVIPFNKRMVPIFICFEALVIGFILGGALMLSEKEEGTIRALRISPMGIDRYLISKTMLFSFIGMFYALLIAIFCVGFDFSLPHFLLLSFFGAAMFSLIGLAFASPFRDINGWFFSMALLLSINMLPVVAYSAPSFSPAWIKLIPSYQIIFAYERILFGIKGNSLPAILVVAGWGMGAYLLSRIVVGKIVLAKGGR